MRLATLATLVYLVGAWALLAWGLWMATELCLAEYYQDALHCLFFVALALYGWRDAYRATFALDHEETTHAVD